LSSVVRCFFRRPLPFLSFTTHVRQSSAPSAVTAVTSVSVPKNSLSDSSVWLNPRIVAGFPADRSTNILAKWPTVCFSRLSARGSTSPTLESFACDTAGRLATHPARSVSIGTPAIAHA
jgi:hypothetical protein